jgi:hypothetical protein
VKHAKKTSYKRGNFIERNIALGPDARFYHALTEDEQLRVDKLLTEEEVTSTAPGFIVNTAELERLVSIDRYHGVMVSKLCEMTPECEWESKSLIWSQPPSTTHTPTLSRSNSTLFFSSVNSKIPTKDIEEILKSKEIMEQHDIFHEDKKNLANIDQKLLNLRSEDRNVFRHNLVSVRTRGIILPHS